MNFKNLFILFLLILIPIIAAQVESVKLNEVNGGDEKIESQKEFKPLGIKDVGEGWKQEVTKQFEQNVAKIKKIIVEGERNKQELGDFLGRFEDQKQWFDMNVSATKNFFDPSYNAVMQKKLSFKRLVKAQDRAEEILKELIEEDKLGLVIRRQIKLAILYNLNSLIQKEVEKGRAEICDSGLSDFEIRRVVTRVFSEVEKKRAEEHEIERIVKKDINELEKQIDVLKRNIEQQKLEKEQIEVKLNTTESELEQQLKSNKELERLLKKIEEDKELLKDEIARRTVFQIRKELKPVIERKNRENMELQLKLKNLEQDLRVIKKSGMSFGTSKIRAQPSKNAAAFSRKLDEGAAQKVLDKENVICDKSIEPFEREGEDVLRQQDSNN